MVIENKILPKLVNINFEKLTDGTDLAYVRTRDIVQDSLGFLYIATTKGLVKYDGITFKIINLYAHSENEPADNNIMSICICKSGNIAIITGSGALLELDVKKEIIKVIIVPFQNYLKGNDSLKIFEDSSENLWIGTSGHGLFKFNKKNAEYVKFDKDISQSGKSVNSDYISEFYFDEFYERLCICTGNGLNVYDFKSQSFSYRTFGKIDPTMQIHTLIQFIYRDKNKNIWLSTPGNLILLDDDYRKVRKYRFSQEGYDEIHCNYLNCMCEDDQGILWIGSGEGFICFDFRNNSYNRFKIKSSQKDEIFSNDILALFKDNSNVMWAGTNNHGMVKFDRNEKRFFKIEIETNDSVPVNKNSYSVFKDSDDEIWIGTVGDGLYKCSRKLNNNYELTKFKELDYVTITSFSRDSENNLWVGCNKYGLIYIDPRNNFNIIDPHILLGELESPGIFTYCQCIDKEKPNHLWLSIVLKKLVILDLEKKILVENKLISDKFENIPVSCLYMDHLNNMWIGTHGFGLYRYCESDNSIINYTHEIKITNSISNSSINVIAEDSENNLWVGTANGLNKFDSLNQEFQRISIPVSFVCGMIFDRSDNLWISEENKLFKFNIRNNEYRIFGGMNEFNRGSYTKSSDGTLYFGGKEGVTYFKPDEIITSQYIPNIVITDFQIFYDSVKPSPENPFLKKSISYAKEITLTYKESVITFEFAALIFNNPKQNQYAYKLEGFDEDWVYCGTRRTATYTNLDPGEYTFRVKGSNNDGLWNEEGTSIKVIITPPWYKTVLFKGLVGLSVIGSIGSFYRKRIQKLNKEKTQQEEFTKKLIESQENERKRVAAELHDSLGQDLLIIKNKALVSIKKNEPDKLLEQMNEISELTSATLNDVREISYNLRPYELDRLGLTKTIESMIERANSSTNINFIGNIDDIDKIFTPAAEINIYRIVQESLNNVIKHSEAQEVIVSVLKKGSEIVVNISDDGKGFDIRNMKRKGFGLKGIEERVRLLNGEFKIESQLGKKTDLKINIPIRLFRK